MKSADNMSQRTKSLAVVIAIGLVGIGILVFLSFLGPSGLRDLRTGTVNGQNIVGKTGSD